MDSVDDALPVQHLDERVDCPICQTGPKAVEAWLREAHVGEAPPPFQGPPFPAPPMGPRSDDPQPQFGTSTGSGYPASGLRMEYSCRWANAAHMKWMRRWAKLAKILYVVAQTKKQFHLVGEWLKMHKRDCQENMLLDCVTPANFRAWDQKKCKAKPASPA